MNLTQLFFVLRARRKILLATLIVSVLATAIVSMLLPKTYEATSSLLLNYKGIDPVSGFAMPGQLMPGYMATQIDIINSKNVALRVVDHLRLAESPAVVAQFNEATEGKGTVREWLADLLLRKVEVTPSRESSKVDVSFKGSDPQFVAAVSNAFAEEYQKLSVQLKVDPMRKASGYFDQQIRLLRDNLESAQSRLSKYQQEHGIVSTDNRLDVESNRLNDLSSQLVVAQAQLMEANSRENAAGSRRDVSPDVASNPLVQNLKLSLSSAESKLADVAERLGRNHPTYQSTKAEVDSLRSELNRQMQVTSQSVGSNAQILRAREASVRTSLAEQKTKVLELNRTRDEMNVLQKEVENAQRAFDVASQRSAQTRIEGQSEQADIALLNPAVAPLEPVGPRVLLNTALSVVLGTILGIGFCLIAEMLDRRVRSSADLSEVLGIPVLGAIDWNATQKRRSRLLSSVMPRRLRLN